jgi:hypothetical protein
VYGESELFGAWDSSDDPPALQKISRGNHTWYFRIINAIAKVEIDERVYTWFQNQDIRTIIIPRWCRKGNPQDFSTTVLETSDEDFETQTVKWYPRGDGTIACIPLKESFWDNYEPVHEQIEFKWTFDQRDRFWVRYGRQNPDTAVLNLIPVISREAYQGIVITTRFVLY